MDFSLTTWAIILAALLTGAGAAYLWLNSRTR
jgi:hypothetical protein